MFSTLCYTKLNAIFSTMNYTKVVMTPNYPVNFSAAFVGDVLTSTSRLIAHFLFSSTYSCMLISSFVLNNSRFSSSFSSSWWDCNHVMKQIFVPYITKPASLALAFFMLGALYMHFRVRDELTKYLPALSMFCGCVAIFLLS